MLLQVILEGIGLGVLLILVCAIGIRKGAVGMVHLYSPEVQERCVTLGLTTHAKIKRNALIMGFILLRVLEFFVFRKMEMPETKNHLLCGWRQSVVQKNHLSVTIELFRHYCKKGKVILWRIRIMI